MYNEGKICIILIQHTENLISIVTCILSKSTTCKIILNVSMVGNYSGYSEVENLGNELKMLLTVLKCHGIPKEIRAGNTVHKTAELA